MNNPDGHDSTEPKPYMNTTEAMEMLVAHGIEPPTRMTLNNWIKKYSLGYKFASRWRVNTRKFKAFLKEPD